ncbi:MAG: hypothetical protein ACOX3Q_02455 [Clostridia bacterium]|jgi:hypothetical protein
MALKTVVADKIRKLLVQGCDRWIVKFDPKTGKFLESNGGWAVTNQDNIFLLSYLYLHDFEGNPYYNDPKAFEIIKAGGNALRAAQREDGQVLFVKTDGSEWGYIYMPWSMFHWLQAYDLMKDHLDQETRKNWEEGLKLAYDGISKELQSMHIHNIPVWNAAATYRAGCLFNREDYKEIANRMMEKTIECQHPDGFWPEHQGPTLSYNSVYIYALGVYKFYGGTVDVTQALERSFKFQQVSVYPDGTLAETADGRVKYDGNIRTGDLIGYLELEGGLSYIDFMLDQVIRKNQSLSTQCVNLLRYLERLPESSLSEKEYVIKEELNLSHGNVQIFRKDGWQVNLSSYTAPITDSRWGMDRQLLVSVWHQDKGLLIGGGNNKYNPRWGTFFIQKKDRVLYVPDKGSKDPENKSIVMSYEDVCCFVKVKSITEEEVVLSFGYKADRAPDQVQIGLPLKFSVIPKENDFSVANKDGGYTVSFKGYDIAFANTGFSLQWPVEPFNPYEKEGRSPEGYWAAVLNIDITREKDCTVKIKKKK